MKIPLINPNKQQQALTNPCRFTDNSQGWADPRRSRSSFRAQILEPLSSCPQGQPRVGPWRMRPWMRVPEATQEKLVDGLKHILILPAFGTVG